MNQIIEVKIRESRPAAAIAAILGIPSTSVSVTEHPEGFTVEFDRETPATVGETTAIERVVGRL